MASTQKLFGYVDFLASEIVSLRTSESTRSFKIHKALLAEKCKVIAAAVESRFKEGEDRLYTCNDTSERTLVRFIEWAYKGDYPDPLYDSTKDQTGNSTEGSDQVKDRDKSPLMSHAELYVFSEVYGIPDLKSLAYEKLTKGLVNTGRPGGAEVQAAVISVLQTVSSGVPSDDSLVEWLAKYAAWCINQLRLHGSFHALLRNSPSFSARVINQVSPAPKAPFKESIGRRYSQDDSKDRQPGEYYEDDDQYDDSY